MAHSYLKCCVTCKYLIIYLLTGLTRFSRDPSVWSENRICYDKPTLFNKKNFCAILNGLNTFYTKLIGQSLTCLDSSDFFNPNQSKFTSENQIVEILQLILGVAMNCD